MMRTIWAKVVSSTDTETRDKKEQLVTLADGTYWVSWTRDDDKLEGSIHFFNQQDQDRHTLTVTHRKSIKILKNSDNWVV